MSRITFTFGPPYDFDGYGWVELIVESGGQIAHGAYAIPIQEAQCAVANLRRVSHAANAESQLRCGQRHGYNDQAPFETALALDIKPTAAPDILAVFAEAIDHFEPSRRVEVEFTVSKARLRQFQRDCGKVMRREAKEAVLAGNDVATAGEAAAGSAAVALAG